jgi:ribonuclease P protein component
LPDDARYGLIATKKTFKHAVDRNRAKRLLRDWIMFNEKTLRNDADYVFIARRAILDADRTSGRTAMRKALHFLRKQKLNA